MKESAHIKVVYRENHSHLVDHIVESGEFALAQLHRVFGYTPAEKITVNTYDVNDYGAGSATTVPRNYIWLDLAPLEPGYENIPYTERIRWLLTHELVHIVVNDLATSTESLARKAFSKVPPDQIQPLSIFYSILTNFGRYTPRWHQEGIAVFLETWLSGGFGRSMGSFSEMYFRSLVDEGSGLPEHLLLDTKVPNESFLIETSHYLFGDRFVQHLVRMYGPEKVLAWYSASPEDLYITYATKFKDIFDVCLDSSWSEFRRAETEFQRKNISRVSSSPVTAIRQLSGSRGGVSQPHVDIRQSTIYWGEHTPHKLAAIQAFNLHTARTEELSTLRTPSLYQVASTAFDPQRRLYFFTTNSNQLYRDIHALNVDTRKQRMLFEDCRVGHLTVASATGELWGIRHNGGVSTLVLSVPPYDSLVEMIHFPLGDEVQGLAVNASGLQLAAVLHKPDGTQSIVVADAHRIKRNLQVQYSVVTNRGSPENPSWSFDDSTIIWNAYTNGVSNIYRMNIEEKKIQAITNTVRGLFRPVFLSEDSLFAFEFSTEGFIPVVFANKLADRLPAIEYYGQKVLDSFPRIAEFGLIKDTIVLDSSATTSEYNGLDHMNVVSFFPVLSGFRSRKVIGLFAHFSDLILNHDLVLETGVSPFGEKFQPTQFHLRIKYEYQKEYEVSWDLNGPDFYDLVNKRKRGMLGNKIRLGNTHYWTYDNPLKVKQQSEIALYTGVDFISDNLVRVSQPDFLVAQTSITSQNFRKTIGSSDFESGNEIAATFMFFGSNPRKPQVGYQLWLEWDHLMPLIADHNVTRFKAAIGYHHTNAGLTQSRFYFGGFGNRALENVDVKQFRKVFRFPGLPTFGYASDRFAKITLENCFPPLRFSRASMSQHFLNHMDFSLFSQALYTNSAQGQFGIDIGAQVNFVLKHWFNLESTLSGGVARAWLGGRPIDEWFVSYKLLRN